MVPVYDSVQTWYFNLWWVGNKRVWNQHLMHNSVTVGSHVPVQHNSQVHSHMWWIQMADASCWLACKAVQMWLPLLVSVLLSLCKDPWIVIVFRTFLPQGEYENGGGHCILGPLTCLCHLGGRISSGLCIYYTLGQFWKLGQSLVSEILHQRINMVYRL